jgi:hypothetical protein
MKIGIRLSQVVPGEHDSRVAYLIVHAEVLVDASRISGLKLFDLDLGQLSILCVVRTNLPAQNSNLASVL